MVLGQKRVGILVGGGPAPGINSAISSATIEAINLGFEVIGLYDGFQHLMRGRVDMMQLMAIPDLSRIHFQGGSTLRTSRANPTATRESLGRTVRSLQQLNISHLVTIGGDDTAFAAAEVARAADGAIRVAHVPKTIDNDLPLPGGMPTFGFETARHVGTELVRNLMEDSRTTSRWYVVVIMGRRAGHLALGIGKAAGVTLTVIPEEFQRERVSIADVCRAIEGSILKRRVQGRMDGLAVVAEGIGELLEPEELMEIPGVDVERDQYGNLRLAEIPLAAILKRELRRRLGARGVQVPIVDRTIGYELRCAPPIPFDIDYTRTLGYGAVRFLATGQADGDFRYGGMVCLESGRLRVVPFDQLRDPVTGRTRARLVDVESESYSVARAYMVRLEPRDLEDPQLRSRLAAEANMSPEEFQREYAGAVGISPQGGG